MEQACASCGAVQPSGARFCNSCGASLQRECPGCGSEQPAAGTFCSNCGIALQEEARPTNDRQERRIVTVVFADLAGSTALGERLDPEDVRELQGELFDLINAEVERYGGTTEKFAGDAVLAVFGIPQAHEDDPERAVRAALAAHEGFVSFTERVHGRHGAEVGLRVGVNTGEVVAGREAAARGEMMVSGDAVNVAARLQQHASPGEVLVGQRTQAATSRTIAYREHEALDAKGKSEPVACWLAVSAAHEQAPPPRGVAGLSAPLVGRNEELAVLTAVASRVERERAPQLVTLFGPAGVGKSRLVAELVERLPGARLVQGRCLSYGEGVTFWPLAEAAKAHAGILDTDSAEVALAKLRAAIESVVPADQTERVLEAAVRTIGLAVPGASSAQPDPHEVLHRLQDGWTRYLVALGREQLTIVAVEDVHWASSALLDLLEQLAEQLADTRVLLLCTARLELLEVRPTWGAGKQNATSLSLTPLSAEDAAHLMSSLLGEARVPGDVRQRLLASAEGNPFYLEEMLHMLIEQGALEPRNGGWVSTDRLDRVAIPDSVHGVIAARIDLLDTSSRDALRRCSVVGRSSWPAAVDVDEQVIASLVRSGLVSDSVDSVMAGMREFSFKHALTRDVAYASLPRPERRDLHRQVGEWVQDVAPDRSAETVELAAYHYGQALDYGEADSRVSQRAFELFLAASELAFGRGAFEAARLQLDRAAEPPKSIGPYIDVSFAFRVLLPGARWKEADAVLAEVARSGMAATARLAFLTVSGALALRRGQAESTRQLVEELQPLALASGEQQRIIPMACVALPWFVISDDRERLRSLTENLLASADRRWPAVLEAAPIVRALATAGETELLERTAESLRTTPGVAASAQTALIAAEGLLALGRTDAAQAVERLETATERERELGGRYTLACLELDLARALEAAGETERAQEARRRAASVLEPLGCVNPF